MSHELDFCAVCFGAHQGTLPVRAYDVDLLIDDHFVRMPSPLDLCERCAQRMSELEIIAAVTLAVMSPSGGLKHWKSAAGAPKPAGLSVQGRLIPHHDRAERLRDIVARLGHFGPSTPSTA